MNVMNNTYGAGFGNLMQPQGQGLALGRMFHGATSTPRNGNEGVSKTFAADVVSRITAPAQEEGQAPKKISDEFLQDSKELADSLSRTVDHVTEKYGKQAGTAVMGMVYQKIGNGPVTEEKLGDAMLSAVKLIDRNFGIEEGDKFMEFLNNDLNNEMNAMFDNGMNERFFAVSPGMQSSSKAIDTALGQIADKFGEDTADAIVSMIDQLMEEGVDPEKAMKDGLKKADDLLKSQQEGELTPTTFSGLLAQNVAAAAPAQPGTLLNVTV